MTIVHGGININNFLGGFLNILSKVEELFSFAGATIKRSKSSSSNVGGGKRK